MSKHVPLSDTNYNEKAHCVGGLNMCSCSALHFSLYLSLKPTCSLPITPTIPPDLCLSIPSAHCGLLDRVLLPYHFALPMIPHNGCQQVTVVMFVKGCTKWDCV